MIPFTPQAGDIIYADRILYKHYGVYIGNDQVVHFAAKKENETDAKNAHIQKTTLAQFLKGDQGYIETENINNAFSPQETVRRALSQVGLGKGQYNLVFRNCEHFARWCKTGIAQSQQVKNVATGVAVGAAAIAVTAIAAAAISAITDNKDNKK